LLKREPWLKRAPIRNYVHSRSRCWQRRYCCSARAAPAAGRARTLRSRRVAAAPVAAARVLRRQPRTRPVPRKGLRTTRLAWVRSRATTRYSRVASHQPSSQPATGAAGMCRRPSHTADLAPAMSSASRRCAPLSNRCQPRRVRWSPPWTGHR
jgi:hypothetical protein